MQSKKGKLSPQKAAKVFSAKKEVTEGDAKKLSNLFKWRKAEDKRIRLSDNLEVFFMGFVAGASLLYIIHVLSV